MKGDQTLIVIVGPTASGKTALAIRIARQFGGEIICADSRTIYKEMNIGTAKPSRAEQSAVPHWGLDLVEPGSHFTAADFKEYANKKIAEIRSRGNIPLLVGGTGLYVDAVVFDYQFGDQPDDEARARYEQMSLHELLYYCRKNNIEIPQNDKNKRYIIRSIEQNGVNSRRKKEPIDKTFIVGITTDRELLRTKIALRAEQLFENGVVEEARTLAKKYGWDNEAMTGNIYPLCRQYEAGELSLEELKEKSVTLDWRLAKRQLTWLRRNEFIKWFGLEQAEHYIASVLASR